MKALITRSAGFIGSALSLLECGGDNLKDDYDAPPTKAMEQGVSQAENLAAPHQGFAEAGGESIGALGAKNSVLLDLNSMLPHQTGAIRF